ncbi:MAG: hypothetical protein H6707_20770 [Deltaproteobacteria bacterium]|nr:hypothetical protein [Deltaproteobacteria bacterium]
MLADFMAITVAAPSYLGRLIAPVMLSDSELDELADLMPNPREDREASLSDGRRYGAR